MRVGITGGAGFIGTNLTLRLKQSGHEITIIDDLSNSDINRVKLLDVNFLNESIVNFDAVKEFLDGLDYVVHLAARGSVPRSIKDPVGTKSTTAIQSPLCSAKDIKELLTLCPIVFECIIPGADTILI